MTITGSKGVESMAERRKSKGNGRENRLRPATTPEGREKQLISLAVDLAEKQLADGTASAQVISHYLKLSSSRERLEQEKLAHENELLVAKSEALASQKRVEELYKSALDAMKSYSGQDLSLDEDDDYDYDD
jgi:hypothetical protein